MHYDAHMSLSLNTLLKVILKAIYRACLVNDSQETITNNFGDSVNRAVRLHSMGYKIKLERQFRSKYKLNSPSWPNIATSTDTLDNNTIIMYIVLK